MTATNIALTASKKIPIIKESFYDNIVQWTIFSEIEPNTIIAEFEFFKEKDKIWLNNCSVNEEARRKGLGTNIVQTAINKFGKLFISKADKGEHKRNNIENDSRYVEPPDGTAFIESLLIKGIINAEWYTNPFEICK